MSIIAVVRCRNLKASVAFYTEVLDFVRIGGDDDLSDPAHTVISRQADVLILSSHRGDGEFGQAVVVTTDDVHAAFRTFVARGLEAPDNPDDPVHRAPIEQTWGTCEFYVDDPDGNTLRFTQGWVP